MKTTSLALFVAALAFAASASAQTPTPTPASPSPASPAVGSPDANNMAPGGGVADRTADPEPTKPSDVKLVKAVRQAVVADASLSIDAKNCEIIARDGLVTLRGPVGSEKERATIVAIATQIAGPGNVTDTLQVKLAAL